MIYSVMARAVTGGGGGDVLGGTNGKDPTKDKPLAIQLLTVVLFNNKQK